MAGKAEKRCRIVVSGRVQSVCFRYYTKRIANKLGIKGYVKNMDDGTVEVVAQGDEEDLKRLVDFCRKGPLFAKVKYVEVKEEKTTDEFEGFEVRY